ncbi:MAG: UvrD-helicase domain-containing protein [bacterium]|nr:UvrD-helicase domain-containing protein [bacterium]
MELNERQKEAVEHGSGPLLMSAGAGSGKTRALTSRLKHLIEKGTKPERILAITFTNKAADEMRERVFSAEGGSASGGGLKRKNPMRLPLNGQPFIGTFHSFGLRLLKQEIEKLNRTPNLSIYDNDKSQSLVNKILKSLDIPKDKYKPTVLAAKISKLKNELKNPKFLEESEYEDDRVLLEVYLRYERELINNNAFDFDDLIEKPVRLFAANQKILQKYQQMFDYVLVDEYQDINRAQYQLIRLLVDKHQNINVVGDDQQAIYKFRGADFRNFLNFSADFPSAKIVKLEQSYRSTKKIIQSANAVIKNNKEQAPKELWTDNEEGDFITVASTESAEEEALWLSSEVQAIKKKDPGSSIAVLYRTNAQSRAIEQAFLAFRISYHIYGGLRFYDRLEIKDVIAALSTAFNPKDSASKERLEKNLGKRRTLKYLESLETLPKEASIIDLINRFLEEADYTSYLATKFKNPNERLENIAELISFATSFDSLGEFLDQVLLLQSNDEESKSPKSAKENKRLKIMTVHIAKGLEFDYVFVIGLNDGILPHKMSLAEPGGIEEERRLMYVAMTRARKKLYISYHNYPSVFLYEIPQSNCEFINADGGELWLPDEDDMYIED